MVFIVAWTSDMSPEMVSVGLSLSPFLSIVTLFLVCHVFRLIPCFPITSPAFSAGTSMVFVCVGVLGAGFLVD